MTRRMVLAAVLLAVASLAGAGPDGEGGVPDGQGEPCREGRLPARHPERMGARRRHPAGQPGAARPADRSRSNSWACPERQALDILLRDVGGYILGPRQTLVAGVSAVRPAGGRHGRRGTQPAAPGPSFPGAACRSSDADRPRRPTARPSRTTLIDEARNADVAGPRRAAGARAARRPGAEPRTAAAPTRLEPDARGRPAPRRATRSAPCRVRRVPGAITRRRRQPPAQPGSPSGTQPQN